MVRPQSEAGRDSSACRLVGRSRSPWEKKNLVATPLSSVRLLTLPLEIAVRSPLSRNVEALSLSPGE
jgi:hypothetical protein